MPSLPLGLLAEQTGGAVRGDASLLIHAANDFSAAQRGEITMALGERYLSQLSSSEASAFIVPDSASLVEGINAIAARHPKLVFARVIALLHGRNKPDAGISAGSFVSEDASVHPEAAVLMGAVVGPRSKVGARTVVHPGVVLMDDVIVGGDCEFFPGVVVYPGCRIGNRVIIHAGTIIGADGFGFVPDEAGRQVRIPQIGSVVIEDDVEIGANCCIDRATFGATTIRAGVKLDNLIQVAHNCEIGENTVIAAQAGFSGSTKVGRSAVIAGQAATNDHVIIGDRVVVGGQAGVTKNVESGMFVAGTPAVHHRDWKRAQVLSLRLPEFAERLKNLEARLEAAPVKRPGRQRRKHE